MATLDEVGLGDHVCWRMGPAATFADARAYLADGALYGDKVVVIGSLGTAGIERDGSPSTSVVLDLPDVLDMDMMLAAVRREVHTATREGFRSVRVLTERMPPTAASGAEELLAGELKLDEFASESGAMVVCAFRPSRWDRTTLDGVACMHPHEVGTRAARPSFRMFSTGADRWSVDGVVDFEGAAAFNAAVRAAVRKSSMVKLGFHDLELIDAAGMQALVEAARHLPGRRIVVEGANETVLLCWELAGFAAADLPVVMAT
ncbi:MEDS domain-containing protein [Kitasatospora sp. NPDC005748]|uniref:MEDS domain-containing protein n=1 Tax=unclassified Kitasatospora TaxID=2633591 RepID=UPI00340E3BB9